jgi:hypothetical protein
MELPMSRESLMAALERLFSSETAPSYKVVLAAGRELHAADLDDFVRAFPLSPARGLLDAAVRLADLDSFAEKDRIRSDAEAHIPKLLAAWTANNLWRCDRSQFINFARAADAELEARTPPAPRPPGQEGPPPASRPLWDRARRVLSLNGQGLYRYRRTAGLQWAMLDAFEAAGWPESIPRPHGLSAHRTKNAVDALNRNLEASRMRFHRADGGRTLVWGLSRV